jgi:hypothetical protein
MHLNRINLEVAVESLLDLPRFSRIESCARTMAVYPEITAFHKLRYIKVLNLKLLQTKFK